RRRVEGSDQRQFDRVAAAREQDENEGGRREANKTGHGGLVMKRIALRECAADGLLPVAGRVIRTSLPADARR
ncbi:MAG TPA: hypothetical protein VHD89_08960, partial [Rhodanobacteraceae bacterium]|nr:hypothetical protein [Rhodanobacteraceae bacterium]